jgi:hypothetical protein
MHASGGQRTARPAKSSFTPFCDQDFAYLVYFAVGFLTPRPSSFHFAATSWGWENYFGGPIFQGVAPGYFLSAVQAFNPYSSVCIRG